MNAHPRALLAARRDDPLAAADEAAVARHLAACPSCRAFEEELARNDARIARGASARVPVPPFAALARGRRRSPALALAAAVAALAVAVLAPLLFSSPADRSAAGARPSALTSLALPPGTVRPSPGELVAVQDATGVWLYDLAGRPATRRDGATFVRWLPDGSGAIVTLGPELAILDAAGARALGVAVPRDPYAYGALDGTRVAVQIGPAEVAIVGRDGATQRIRVPDGAVLAGWDAEGSVLVGAGTELRALAPDGATRWTAPIPAAGRNLRTEPSPDRRGVLVIGGGGVWALRDRALAPVPTAQWVGPHEVLGRDADGRFAAVDVTTGGVRPLAYTAPSALATVRGASGGYAVVSPESGDMLLVDLATGARRALPGIRRAEAVDALPDARFLFSGDTVRVLDAREAFR